VALLDEGIDVRRPVEAKRLAPDCYLIIDQDYAPGVEKWEFEPGTVVKCRKEHRGGRDILVAIEAARQTVAG
jgi:hypothetical protein